MKQTIPTNYYPFIAMVQQDMAYIPSLCESLIEMANKTDENKLKVLVNDYTNHLTDLSKIRGEAPKEIVLKQKKTTEESRQALLDYLLSQYVKETNYVKVRINIGQSLGFVDKQKMPLIADYVKKEAHKSKDEVFKKYAFNFAELLHELPQKSDERKDIRSIPSEVDFVSHFEKTKQAHKDLLHYLENTLQA